MNTVDIDVFKPENLGEVFRWCADTLGPGHVSRAGSYFDPDAVWYAHLSLNDDRSLLFEFKDPEHATLFSLRWL